MSDENWAVRLVAQQLRQYMARERCNQKEAAQRLGYDEATVSRALKEIPTAISHGVEATDQLFFVSTGSTGFSGSHGTLGIENLDDRTIDASNRAQTGFLRELAARERLPNLSAALDRADIAADLGKSGHDAEAEAELPKADDDHSIIQFADEVERIRSSKK